MEIPTKDKAIASNRDAWNDSARHHKDSAEWQALLNSVTHADFSCLDDTLTGLLTQVGVDGKAVVQLGCNNDRESLSLYAWVPGMWWVSISRRRFSIRRGNWRRAHPVIPNSSRRTFTTCRFSCRVASTWR
jgi:hypothetical protein